MLKITNHERDANLNHDEISPPTGLPSINQQTTSAGEDVEKFPFALLVGMQTGAATVESSLEIPQKIKNGSVF